MRASRFDTQLVDDEAARDGHVHGQVELRDVDHRGDAALGGAVGHEELADQSLQVLAELHLRKLPRMMELLVDHGDGPDAALAAGEHRTRASSSTYEPGGSERLITWRLFFTR